MNICKKLKQKTLRLNFNSYLRRQDVFCSSVFYNFSCFWIPSSSDSHSKLQPLERWWELLLSALMTFKLNLLRMLTYELKWLITFHLKISASFLCRLSSLVLTIRVKVESFCSAALTHHKHKIKNFINIHNIIKTWFSLLRWDSFCVAKKEILFNDADSISFNHSPASTAHELPLVYSFC